MLEHLDQGRGQEGRNQWFYRQQSLVQQSLCSLSARGPPKSSPAVNQEAPTERDGGAHQEQRQDFPQAQKGSLAHPWCCEHRKETTQSGHWKVKMYNKDITR